MVSGGVYLELGAARCRFSGGDKKAGYFRWKNSAMLKERDDLCWESGRGRGALDVLDHQYQSIEVMQFSLLMPIKALGISNKRSPWP